MIKTICYKGINYKIEQKNDTYIVSCCGNDEDTVSLTQYEYEQFLQASDKDTEDLNNHLKLVSFYNDMIVFNPFQYKPYLKLASMDNKWKCVYISDEVGVGKTFETGIIISELLYARKMSIRDNILIICPNMLCRKWQEVLNTFFGLASTTIKSFDKIHGISIMSYDSVSRAEADFQYLFLNLLIIDEAHNANGKRFKKILSVRDKSEYTVLISATPLAGKDSDENAQKLLLFGSHAISEGFNFETESEYFNRTLKEEMRNRSVEVKIKNVPVINSSVIDYINLCSEIFQKRNTIRKFAGINMIISSPASAKAYCEYLLKLDNESIKTLLIGSKFDKETMDEYGLESLEEVEELFSDSYGNDIITEDFEISNETVERIKLSIKSLNEDVVKVLFKTEHDDKLNALKRIISDNTNKSQTEDDEARFYKKCIVFTNFNETAKYLNANIEKSIVINGTIVENEKWKRFNEFKSSNEYNVLIITNVACEGQDMDFCNTIVNYDLTYNPVQLAQRKGRIDRFEIKKSRIFIYNFAIQDVDPTDADIDRWINSPDLGKPYPNSIYTVLLRKLKTIAEQTGIYYNVIDSIGRPAVQLDKEAAQEKLLCLFKALFGDIEKYEDITKRHSEISSQNYFIINKLLEEKAVTVQPAAACSGLSEKITITVDKRNHDFLKYLYDGGTINSHLIYNTVRENNYGQ